MEAFGIIGMCLGLSGFVFGLIALVQSSQLRSELAELKSTLKESGKIEGESD